MTINKKKIIIFSMSYYPRFVGGAEVALKEITDRINVNEYEFHLVTLRYDSSFARYEKIGNVHVYRIGYTQRNPSFKDLRALPLRFNKVLYQFWAPCIGWWLHRKIKFQTVWAMMAHSSGVPANIFSFFLKIPLILTLQEGDPTNHIEKQMRIFGPLFTTVFKRASHIQVISQFLKEWAVKMGARKENIEIIPNAVDGSTFTYRNEYRQRQIKRIITTSRLVPKNGTDILLRALALLPDTFHLDVVGDGYQKQELECLGQELGISHRVIFHGQKNQNEIVLLLKEAFIFCRPSRSEGLGNSFLEAMAVGVPVIATPVGGIPDFLFDPGLHGDKATGLFCNSNDEKSVARCVIRYNGDADFYKNIAYTAMQLIQKKYTWDKVAEEMRKLFKKT